MGKRTCYGCRALEVRVVRAYSENAVCLLGFGIEMKDKAPLRPEPVPLDGKCPKPRTYSELFKLLDEKELKR